MGIYFSCTACKLRSTPNSNPQPPAATVAVAEPVPEPDPVPSSIVNVIDGDTSLLDSNLSRSSWFSMATNVTALVSQVSGRVAAFFENNNEENEFLASIEDEDLPDGGVASESKLRSFTLAQLKAATFSFRRNMVLGHGGFGSVYKGYIKEKVPFVGIRKRAIAVKTLDANSKQGFRQWRAEVGFLARLSHPNIVKLVGYCKEDQNFIIVYEFMPKGSLNYHLFRQSSKETLPWKTRVTIMVGMARGLSYLHKLEKPIIYRDFKSSNVLLDESYTPKISDFGLAKWGPTDGNSSVSGRVMGTKGYTAPEYIAEGIVFIKSDVYSFGVVLVEMLTGLRALDRSRPIMEQNLVVWLKPILSYRVRFRRMMDPKLEGKYSEKEALAIARIADKCLIANPQRRPSMTEVMDELEKIEAKYGRKNGG